MDRVFRRADILLPHGCDLTKWSMVACDQYTSQPEYWAEMEHLAGDAPSTLRLMLPEAYLETKDQFAEAETINAAMRDYLRRGIFTEERSCYVYLERTLRSGEIRRGLVGVLDLEAYDFSADSASPVRATEGTVESRLPPRVRVRSGAALEMPHIMVFLDDPDRTVIEPLTAERDSLPLLYDFDLNGGGGHVRGFRVGDTAADRLDARLDALSDPEALRARYGDSAPVIFAMGDGNHSLATAKKCWEALKPSLSAEECETHPARFGLVELVNIHDDAISFEPIHRVLFNTDPCAFLAEAGSFLSGLSGEEQTSHTVRVLTGAGEKTVAVSGMTIGNLIGRCEEFAQQYIASHGGSVDYIHNDDTAVSMGRQPGCASVLLPKMEKSELFPSVIRSGPFPKKSFSIGHAEDKRYYLECRKIRTNEQEGE